MQKNRNKIIKICLAAIFAALYMVLDMLAISLSANIKITFGGLPILLASFLLGPVYGAAAGTVGSFISQMLKYGFSATTVLWILPAAVRGISAGLLFIAFKKRTKIIPLGITIITSSILVTAYNTLAIYVDSVVNHYYSFVYVFGDTVWRVVSSLLSAIVYTAIILPLLKAIQKDKKLEINRKNI